jgi:predicted transcriptional regulator
MFLMPTTSFTTRLDSELKTQLDEIARYEDRSSSYIANQAIKNFVEERLATRELVELGLKLAEQDAPTISSKQVHDWFMADEDTEFPIAKHKS